MNTSHFHTADVLTAMQQAWDEFRAENPSPNFGGCGLADTPSRFVKLYAGIVQAKKAASRAGGSAKAHLLQRCANKAGAMMDDTLREALDSRLALLSAPAVAVDALTGVINEARDKGIDCDAPAPAPRASLAHRTRKSMRKALTSTRGQTIINRDDVNITLHSIGIADIQSATE